MTKLAIALLVLGAVFLFVDHQHLLLADDIYCRIGAGELREPPPQARGAGATNNRQSRWQNQYCLHGSVWGAITGTRTERQAPHQRASHLRLQQWQ
jgi:hypothetical protein